ncbi:MAG: hypothetical protein V3T65_05630 [Acidobacteriota bacterium]
MQAARLEQKRQNGELAGSMANVGTWEGSETLRRAGCLADKFALFSISLLEAKACDQGGKIL